VLETFPHFFLLTGRAIQARERALMRKYGALREAVRRESLTKKQLHSDFHEGNARLDDAGTLLRERDNDLNVRESRAAGLDCIMRLIN
jgi:hypothetical protein